MTAPQRSSGRGAARCGDRMTTKLWGGGETHRGHVRDDNQDVILVEPDLGLYAVLDGMGGANAGDVAARMAGQAIAACMSKKSRIRRHSPRQLLELALHTANVEVFTASQQRPDYRGMGTTVVACLVVDPTRVVIGHAGDSRAYLLRDEELVALTRDHTVAQDLVDAGALSFHAMERSPYKHRQSFTKSSPPATGSSGSQRPSAGSNRVQVTERLAER